METRRTLRARLDFYDKCCAYGEDNMFWIEMNRTEQKRLDSRGKESFKYYSGNSGRVYIIRSPNFIKLISENITYFYKEIQISLFCSIIIINRKFHLSPEPRFEPRFSEYSTHHGHNMWSYNLQVIDHFFGKISVPYTFSEVLQREVWPSGRIFNFNSHAGGMAVALPYGFETDFVRNPFSGSASSFFRYYPWIHFYILFWNQNLRKKFLDTKKIHFRSPIFINQHKVNLTSQAISNPASVRV